MSSSAFPSPDPSRGPLPESPPGAGPEPAEEDGLMERVLRETQAVTEADPPLDGSELELLRGVARQYAGSGLTLQPVVVALVRAILTARFGALARRPEFWQTMTERIAATLWEDPPSQERLQTMWVRLSETVR